MMRRFITSAGMPATASLCAGSSSIINCGSSSRHLSADAIERAARARSAISTLWSQHGNDPISPLSAIHNDGAALPSASPTETDQRIAECAAAARSVMDEFKLSPQVARDEDITSALGDALERLLLLLVPLEPESMPYIERALLMAARVQHELGIRTIQHMFARTRTYAEALTLFHLLRTCHVKMNMHSYYAMIFCLQRLEEESWALRFRAETAQRKQERKSSKKKQQDGVKGAPDDTSEPSVQALQFVLRGCDNQLLPESKPWLGRVAFSDAEGSYAFDATTKTADSFDALSSDWSARFRKEESRP